ncbi:MAG TPA: colanic acid biosynthesis glycosyltransferase WcaL [Planctomycetes bacterium]|nr:colanic acid biosynthesis glycosyltransferase WcaL [Planctomycetota bacterium]
MSPPRTAYLLKKFPRLSETFVLGELLAQEELGRDLHIFSRRPTDDEPRHPALSELRACVEQLPSRSELDPWKALFTDLANPSATFARLGALVEEARAWELPRFSSLVNEALFVLGRCTELGIGHIHAHFATDSALVAMLVHDLGGPSYSITAHAKDIYRSTVRPEMLSRLFARSAFTVTVCDANHAYLAERLTPEAIAKVRRLYNGIDLDDFASLPRERERNHVLAVGRLVEKKGFDVLLDAASLLVERGVDFRMTIVGTGDEEAALHAQAERLGLTDRVRLTGSLDQSKVRDLMQRATLLCQPCVVGEDGNRDALPTVLLEALACGLPAISTPVTGIPEILDHGRCGRIVPERDAQSTADAIAEMLADEDGRTRLAEAGRARAAELFDRGQNARILYSWFEEALSRRPDPCALPA